MIRSLILPGVSVVLAYGVARVMRESFVRIMEGSDFVAVNYRGKPIPKGMGVIIPLASFVPIAVLHWAEPSHSLAPLWFTLLFGMAFLGLFDDAAGDRSHGGFAEHLRALIAGNPTTGALKALYGGGLCLYAGWILFGTWHGTLIAALLIALSTNSINLLDVRPGRALKGYAMLVAAGGLGLVLLPSTLSQPWIHLSAGLAPVGAGVALLYGDVRGDYMIGDTGSNVFGVAGGLLLAGGPLWWQLGWLTGFIALHLLTEKRSLTEIIEGNPLLNRIDRWGRS